MKFPRDIFTIGLTVSAIGAASPVGSPAPSRMRSASIRSHAQIETALAALSHSGRSDFGAGYADILHAIQPSPTPTAAHQVAAALSSIAQSSPNNRLAAGPALVLSGLTGNARIGHPRADVEAFGAANGDTNVNPAPHRKVYPRLSPADAPYDLPEHQLRAAIFLPPTFTHGKIPPVLFVPGTGVEAYANFAPNIGQLIAGSDVADPVYLNIPHHMLDDEQTNAEYVAYAIHYVAAITNDQNVSVVSWSAGGIVTQWALKYWPSTRRRVSTVVAVSPDFRGSVEEPLLCPGETACPPAVLQQNAPAKFIAQLRRTGGARAYVPTTAIHSIFDEIVEPQQGDRASAALGARAPVTNVPIQDVCPPGTVAGGPHLGHENALYNPVAVANVLDAVTHRDVADPRRAGPYHCSQLMATGLSLSDVFATEFLIPLAALNIATYPAKTRTEPEIKPYALRQG